MNFKTMLQNYKKYNVSQCDYLLIYHKYPHK